MLTESYIVTDSDPQGLRASTPTVAVLTSKPDIPRYASNAAVPKLTETPGAPISTVVSGTSLATFTYPIPRWTAINAPNLALPSRPGPHTLRDHSFPPIIDNFINSATQAPHGPGRLAEQVKVSGAIPSTTNHTTEANNQSKPLTASERKDIEAAEMAIEVAALKLKVLPLHLRVKMDGENLRAAIASIQSSSAFVIERLPARSREGTQQSLPRSRNIHMKYFRSPSLAIPKTDDNVQNTAISRGLRDTQTVDASIFRQICEREGAGRVPLTEADISAAFEICNGFDISHCVSRLRLLIGEMSVAPHGPPLEKGILGMDGPKIVLQRLEKLLTPNSHVSGNDKFRSFRTAWNLISFMEAVDYELGAAVDNGYSRQLSSYKDLEKKWGFTGEPDAIAPTINWTKQLEQGRIWKNWSKVLSNGTIEDRGVLLLLAAVETGSGNQATSPTGNTMASNFEIKGGDIKWFQLMWIKIYIDRHLPMVEQFAKFLDPWALVVFKRDWLGRREARKFLNGLEEFISE